MITYPEIDDGATVSRRNEHAAFVRDPSFFRRLVSRLRSPLCKRARLVEIPCGVYLDFTLIMLVPSAWTF